MSDEYKTIAVRVSRNKKERWEEYAEESHQNTLSQLVRIAVEREIAQEDSLQPPEQRGQDTTEPASEVVDKLNEIKSNLRAIDRRLSTLESDKYGDEDITELATNIHAILPSSIAGIQHAVAEKHDIRSVDQDQSQSVAVHTGAEGIAGKASNQSDSDLNYPCTGSVEDIARRLDADEEAVYMAIKRLQNTTFSVYSTESGDGTVHYYKED
jgi:hypothetical protein